MKNVNLTSLYLNLIAKCDITNFNVSSIKKNDSTELTDVMIRCNVEDIASVNIDEIKTILNANIIGEVKQASVRITDNYLQLYVEFLGNDADAFDKLS